MQAPNTAVKACVRFGDWENTRFQLILPPIRGDLGACQHVTRPIFNENGTWTHEPPSGLSYVPSRRVFMMTSDGECPPHNDSRYILTNQITEGAFIAATRFWEQVLSGENLEMLLGSESLEIRTTTAFRSFEDTLKSNLQGPSSLKLVSVSRVPSDPVRTTAHYALLVDGPRGAWSLVVDFDDGRLRLLNVHIVHF